MQKVYLPFDTPVYSHLNSNHPLAACLVNQKFDGIEFTRKAPPEGDGTFRSDLWQQAGLFAEHIDAGRIDLPRNNAFLTEFILSRSLPSQSLYDTSADLAFLHTAPMSLDLLPYMMHFESMTSLFFPFIHHGETKNRKLKEEYVFWYVRTLLESKKCRQIFTNLSASIGHIADAFDSDIISNKIRYVPPGPYFTPEEIKKISDAVEAKKTRQEVNILFTNSWHQGELSFFLRGGLDLVLAFLEIEKDNPHIRLTLRSILPGVLNQLKPNFNDHIRNHPKITVLEEMIPEDEIVNLYLNADIFSLNSSCLHSLSVLRGMYCGAVCVVPDLEGYEEYITHGEEGIVLKGMNDEIVSEEPGTRWIREDYSTMFGVSMARTRRLAAALKSLCDNPEWRRAMGMKARMRVMRDNSYLGWKNGFENVMRDALSMEQCSAKRGAA